MNDNEYAELMYHAGPDAVDGDALENDDDEVVDPVTGEVTESDDDDDEYEADEDSSGEKADDDE